MATASIPRLQAFYNKEVVPQLAKEFSFKNAARTPKLEKIVLNVGLGEAVANPKAIEAGLEALTQIAGQKPVVTKAKKSIATYKLRQGMPIGVTVTLRRQRMWEFLDRLVNVALPRVRDFRGVMSKFDGNGNCSLGVKEQIIFPEVDYNKIDKMRGLNICIVTTAGSDTEGKALLKALGLPFRR
jgi:large subunit ribosomal protein L5